MSTLVIGLALAAGLAGAPASGVPPIGLPACGEAQDVGGWEMRDFVATGTSATERSPVRLRNVRLSEPCYVPVAGTDVGLLTIPMRATDIPAGMKDDDDDGKDDGAPDLGGEGGPTVVYAGKSVTYMGVVFAFGQYAHCFRANAAFVVAALSGTGATGLSPGGDSGWLNACAAEFGGAGGDYAYWNRGTTPITPSSMPGYGFYQGAFPYGTWLAHSGDSWQGTLGTDYYGGTQGAEFVPGAGHSLVPSGEDTMIYCATSYNGAETISYAWDSSLPWVASYLLESDTEADSLGPPRMKDGQATSWTAMGHVGITDATFTSASCPYLVRIELWVCIYVDHGPNDYSCTETTWTADKYREHGWYEDNGGPLSHICTLYPDDPQCYDVLNPPYIDGTSWDATCGKNFPQLAWGDWDWLPSVVRHLSSCLFTPVNGLDRLGWVRNAVDQSALGQVNELLNAGLDSFAFSPGCGPLVDDTDGPTGLELNTCEWNDWAGQFRPIMATVLVVGFALWALHFIISMLTGIPNKVVPNPTSNKGE